MNNNTFSTFFRLSTVFGNLSSERVSCRFNTCDAIRLTFVRLFFFFIFIFSLLSVRLVFAHTTILSVGSVSLIHSLDFIKIVYLRLRCEYAHTHTHIHIWIALAYLARYVKYWKWAVKMCMSSTHNLNIPTDVSCQISLSQTNRCFSLWSKIWNKRKNRSIWKKRIGNSDSTIKPNPYPDVFPHNSAEMRL